MRANFWVFFILVMLTHLGVRAADSFLSEVKFTDEDTSGLFCNYSNNEKVIFYAGINNEEKKWFGYASVSGKNIRFEGPVPVINKSPSKFSAPGIEVNLDLVEVECPPEGEIACDVSLYKGTLILKKGKHVESLNINGECGG